MTNAERLEGTTAYLRGAATPRPDRPQPRVDQRVLTISREAGTGAHEVGERCIALLDDDAGPPWMLVDRDLVGRVMADHGLPDRLAASMPEDRVPVIADALSGLFGDPDAHSLAHMTAETIARLAEIGRVVIIGRGANVVLGRRRHTYHVRLIGSPAVRVARVRERESIDEVAAAALVRRTDAARRRYVETHHGVDPTDPLRYDLIVNMDRASAEAAAATIVAGVRSLTEAPSTATVGASG